MKRNELLVILEGETLWEAAQRHRLEHGLGRLVLVLADDHRQVGGIRRMEVWA